jgi:hypothetical protein
LCPALAEGEAGLGASSQSSVRPHRPAQPTAEPDARPKEPRCAQPPLRRLQRGRQKQSACSVGHPERRSKRPGTSTTDSDWPAPRRRSGPDLPRPRDAAKPWPLRVQALGVGRPALVVDRDRASPRWPHSRHEGRIVATRYRRRNPHEPSQRLGSPRGLRCDGTGDCDRRQGDKSNAELHGLPLLPVRSTTLRSLHQCQPTSRGASLLRGRGTSQASTASRSRTPS